MNFVVDIYIVYNYEKILQFLGVGMLSINIYHFLCNWTMGQSVISCLQSRKGRQSTI